MSLPEYVYVASSWRNPVHDRVCTALRVAGVEHYDFKNPPNGAGFGWEQTRSEAWEPCEWAEQQPADVSWEGILGPCDKHPSHRFAGRTAPVWPGWEGKIPRHMDLPVGSRHTETIESYMTMMAHPAALAGFEADFSALERASHVVLVLPCGKSAHLELGCGIGAGKHTAILLEEPMEPELMYHAADVLLPSQADLMDWLGVPRDRA